MGGILVDSNILLDLFQNDPNWVDWSESILERCSMTDQLYINQIV